MGQSEEIRVVQRFGYLQSRRTVREAELFDASGRAGMQRQHDGNARRGKLGEQQVENFRAVDVLGPMQGGQDVSACDEPVAGQQVGSCDWSGQYRVDCFDDGVAGEHDAVLRNCLGEQVGAVEGGGGAAEVGKVVDQDPIVFFRHGAVEAAQASFYVHERQVGMVCGERTGECGGGVALDEDHRRRVDAEPPVEGGDHAAKLYSAARRAVPPGGEVLKLDAKGCSDPGSHPLVIVLASVDDHGIRAEQVDDRSEFDQLGTGAQYEGHVAAGHGSPEQMAAFAAEVAVGGHEQA